MVEIEVTSPIIEMLNKYGFATVAAVAMGWFIFFIYNYVTQNIIEKLDKAQMTTIALIDRIRMLDNDLIRLRSKLNSFPIEIKFLDKSFLFPTKVLLFMISSFEKSLLLYSLKTIPFLVSFLIIIALQEFVNIKFFEINFD